MTGQDAVSAASAFDEALGIDGVLLTKLDGDAQGGGYALELGKPGLTFSKLILLNCTRCGSRLFGYFLLCHPGFFPGRFYAFASGHAFTSCG